MTFILFGPEKAIKETGHKVIQSSFGTINLNYFLYFINNRSICFFPPPKRYKRNVGSVMGPRRNTRKHNQGDMKMM